MTDQQNAEGRDIVELLPCPFCGSEAWARDRAKEGWVISCGGDECLGPHTTAFSRQDAEAQWNARHQPQPESAATPREVELEKAIEAMLCQLSVGDTTQTLGQKIDKVLELGRAALFQSTTKQWRDHADELYCAILGAGRKNMTNGQREAVDQYAHFRNSQPS